MYFWKTVKTLDTLKTPEWDELVALSLKDDVHPKRVEGFKLAREALRLALKEAGISAPIMDLVVKEHCHLDKFPEVTLSLSHTRSVGAAIVAPAGQFRSVGIDIEAQTRVVPEEILARIHHAQDANLRNLEIWCLKEAIYKCLSNSGKVPDPIPFSSLVVAENKWSHPASGSAGTCQLMQDQQHLIALAFWKS